MRIARVLTRLNLGGPARQVLASDPILQTRGHDVLVLAGASEPGEGSLIGDLRAAGVDVLEVPGLRRGWSAALLDDRRAGRFVERALREFTPDVVHTHASKAGAIGRRAVQRAVPGTPCVHTFHGHVLEGYFPEPLSAVLRRIERHLAMETAQVLAVSEATRSDLVRLGVVGPKAVDVCQPGIRLEPFLGLELYRGAGAALGGGQPTSGGGAGASLRKSLSIPPEAPVIGVIGRLAPVKRTVLAIDVFAAVASEFPDAWMLVAGDGAERKKVEARLGLLPESIARRVVLLGAVDSVVAVHGAVDLLLSTSSSEGMPVAMIEAAASARCVVSTAVGGVPELIQNGITGLLAVDRDGLAAAIGGLLSDPVGRLEMGRRARARVVEKHSASALALRLEETYAKVLSGAQNSVAH